jgi:hypothetical protein
MPLAIEIGMAHQILDFRYLEDQRILNSDHRNDTNGLIKSWCK